MALALSRGIWLPRRSGGGQTVAAKSGQAIPMLWSWGGTAAIVLVCEAVSSAASRAFPGHPAVRELPWGALLVWVIGYQYLRSRRLWRFLWRSRRFVSVWGGRVVLKYDPQLRGRVDVADVLAKAKQALAHLEATFGCASRFSQTKVSPPGLLGYPVTVYLVPSSEAVSEVVDGAAAFSLVSRSAIVVPFTGLPLELALRHELTHLFAGRPWTRSVPRLLTEGLAEWLQDPAGQPKLDRHAAEAIAAGRGDLRPLLDDKAFDKGPELVRAYALAASFSGFLLRRFGLDAYFAFYNRMHNGWRFEAKFQEQFGRSLADAESEWHAELRQESAVPALA
jgi:hypothetical protein